MNVKTKSYVCGLDAAVDLIAGKWKVLIIWAIADESKRFGQLRRLVPGISEKMLYQHLREMEADNLVRREEFDEVPARVEYSLTPLGHSLNAALEPLNEWGARNMASGDPAACGYR
ncbi:winged helix-turn-helix transcriptional regulator [Saccharothrix hoggarensis]|uniref:Winged helix-turn-helix transcriptional regulator n=1 Tax=Saccharothrix hoggarensis TaxID=913853 RepID=A0ABW3QMQ4_9PSEU